MAHPASSLAFALLLLVSFASCQTILRFGNAASLTGGTGLLTTPGCEMAVEDINANDALLPNYTLVMDGYDTQGIPSVGLGEFTSNYLDSNQTWVAHIGPGRSVVTQPVAQLADYYSLPIVSPSSTSPSLSDKASYPWFMRVVGPDDNQGRAWATLAKQFGWSRVGLLSSTESIHFFLAQAFQSAAVAENIEVETFQTFDPDPSDEDIESILRDLERRKLRIIFLACYDSEARNFFRLVGNYDLVGEGFGWIGSDSWIQSGVNLWDLSDGESYPNGDADRELVRQNSIGVISTQPAGGVGTAYDDFEIRYLNRTGFQEVGTYATFCYDAVYFMALGLHHFLVELGDTRSPMNESFRDDLRQYLFFNVSFTGVTGEIELNENGDRIPLYEVLNVLEDGPTVVAYADENEYNALPGTEILWMGGTLTVPPDSANKDSGEEFDTNLIVTLIVVFAVVAMCALVLCFILVVTIVLSMVAIAFATRGNIIREHEIILEDPDYRSIAFGPFYRKGAEDEPPVSLDALLADMRFAKVWCRCLAREGASDVLHGVVLYYIGCSRISELFDVLIMDILENGDYRVAQANNYSLAYAFRSFSLVYGIRYLFERVAYTVAELEYTNKKKYEKRQEQQSQAHDVDSQKKNRDLRSSTYGGVYTADISLDIDPSQNNGGIKVNLNTLQLKLVVQKIIESFCVDQSSFPTEMRRILSKYRARLEDLWHLSQEEAIPVIGTLMCMRFICPALTLPAQHGLLPDPPLNLRIYILIGKILNQLGSGKPFSKKDGMWGLNDFLNTNQDMFNDFIINASTYEDEEDELGLAEGDTRELSTGVTVPSSVRQRILASFWSHMNENSRDIWMELEMENEAVSRFTGKAPDLSDVASKFSELFHVQADRSNSGADTSDYDEIEMDELYEHVTTLTRKELRKKRRQQTKKLKPNVRAPMGEGETTKHWNFSRKRRKKPDTPSQPRKHDSSAESGKKTSTTGAKTPEQILSSGAKFIEDPLVKSTPLTTAPKTKKKRGSRKSGGGTKQSDRVRHPKDVDSTSSSTSSSSPPPSSSSTPSSTSTSEEDDTPVTPPPKAKKKKKKKKKRPN